MADITKIEKEARKLCTHTIVFTDPLSRKAAARAMQGRTTKSIAEELGITFHEAQYRINKAQKSRDTRFRRDYRDGTGKVAQKMMQATESIAMHEIDQNIAPQFIPFARAGVPRH